jgi:hypothetical protein
MHYKYPQPYEPKLKRRRAYNGPFGPIWEYYYE